MPFNVRCASTTVWRVVRAPVHILTVTCRWSSKELAHAIEDCNPLVIACEEDFANLLSTTLHSCRNVCIGLVQTGIALATVQLPCAIHSVLAVAEFVLISARSDQAQIFECSRCAWSWPSARSKAGQPGEQPKGTAQCKPSSHPAPHHRTFPMS